MLELADDGGWVGEITADSFMKREFGKVLIEQVLARKDLSKVVATSGAFIPGHGTPTVILFARNQSPRGDSVRVVMSKRGEPGRPADAAKGKVWSSIVQGHATAGFENEFISVADVPRSKMNSHEWNIGGGGAAELKEQLDATATLLGSSASDIGFDAILGEDDAYAGPGAWLLRIGANSDRTATLCEGDALRDWSAQSPLSVYFPYDSALSAEEPGAPVLLRAHFWQLRTMLAARMQFGKTTVEAGLAWFEYRSFYKAKRASSWSIAFGEVATHNHFVLDRGGKVFKQTAPVIKLPPGASESEHLVLLAQLNSSTACFWLKQVCQNKGAGGSRGSENVTRLRPDEWAEFYQFGGTKLEAFPLIATKDETLEGLAKRLDGLASERIADSAETVLASTAPRGPRALRDALAARRAVDTQRLFRMVGLQEELDWLCYKLYGLDPEGEERTPDAAPSLTPGQRAFELTLAQQDAERRDAVARGEEPDEAPTQWFTRHGWQPEMTLDQLPEGERAIVQARIERTQASRELSLLEQPAHKRRWYNPDYATAEHEAMELWLDDRLEAWGKERAEPFTAAHAGAALRSDAGVLAVGELLTGRSDFDVDALIAERLRLAAVPNLKHHVFKPEGIRKRAEWEKTWYEQHKEDRGEPAKPEVPPKYDAKDYLKNEYWSLRGKLDVPKNRFIAFTEVLPPVGAETLYAWAGWTPRERAKAMLGLDEKLEAAKVSVSDRHGLLYGVWFLLPYVAWESPEAASDFRADVRSLVGENGVTEAMLDEWAKRFPPPKSGKPAKTKAPLSNAPKKSKRGGTAKQEPAL